GPLRRLDREVVALHGVVLRRRTHGEPHLEHKPFLALRALGHLVAHRDEALVVVGDTHELAGQREDLGHGRLGRHHFLLLRSGECSAREEQRARNDGGARSALARTTESAHWQSSLGGVDSTAPGGYQKALEKISLSNAPRNRISVSQVNGS